MSDGTSFDDVRPGEARSTLRMIERAIKNGWDIPENIRRVLPQVAAKVLVEGKSDSAKLRAVEVLSLMHDREVGRLFELLKVETNAAMIGMNAPKGDELRTDLEEILMVRVQRMRKENARDNGSIERVVAAGMRRLGLATGDPAGDGAPAAGPDSGVRD